MYRCLNCGHLFEDGEQKEWEESRGECWGTQCYEKMQGCPICGESFEEIQPCKICGGYENIESGEQVCENCKSKILKQFRELINDNFGEEEKQVLNELIEDGEEI